MQCIITGCGLTLDCARASTWGDLYEEGDVYIMSAGVSQTTGQTSWANNMYFTEESDLKGLIYHGAGHVFDKRGVIVLPKSECTLNAAARKYLKV
jgi:hypothetical protein